MLPAETENLSEVVQVVGEVLIEYEDLIYSDKTEGKLTMDKVHHPLECVSSVPEAKGHVQKFKHTKWSN